MSFLRKTVLFTLFIGGMLLPELTIAQNRYNIGVCDWMVLKRQKLGEFKLAHELGCDGLEMDMGGLGRRDSFDNKMRDPKMAEIFTRTADSLGIKVGAVAMSGFYGQSLAKKDSYKWLTEDCPTGFFSSSFGASVSSSMMGSISSSLMVTSFSISAYHSGVTLRKSSSRGVISRPPMSNAPGDTTSLPSPSA